MNIETGTTYQTRNGNLAVVEAEHKDEPIYQFSGRCFDENGNTDRIAYWMSSGRYSAAHQSEFDIAEPTPNAGVTEQIEDAKSRCVDDENAMPTNAALTGAAKAD